MSLLDYALLRAFVACQEACPEEETWPMWSAWSLRPQDCIFGSSGPCSLNGSWTALCCIVYSGYKLWRFCAAFGPSQEEGHVLGPLLPESWDLVQCNGSVSVIELYIAFTVMYFVNGQPSFLIAMATHFSLLTIMEVRHCAFLRSSLALLCLILRPFGFVFESCLNHRDVWQVVRLIHPIQNFLWELCELQPRSSAQRGPVQPLFRLIFKPM